MADGIASPPGPPAATDRGGSTAPVPWFRGVTFYSVMAGLCPLIPVPFLDDRVLDAVKRRMTTVLARERGVTLTARQRDFLAGTWSEPKGCLERAGGLAVKLTVKLVGKIFRKVLIFLALKEASDVASRTFHEGYLLHLLLDPATPPGWPEPGEPRADDGAWRARWAIDQAIGETDPRPVNRAVRRAFRGSGAVLRRSARVLARGARAGDARGEERTAAVEAEEESRLSGVVDPLASELWRERGYLDALEARFRHWHRTAKTTAHPPEEPAVPA